MSIVRRINNLAEAPQLKVSQSLIDSKVERTIVAFVLAQREYPCDSVNYMSLILQASEHDKIIIMKEFLQTLPRPLSDSGRDFASKLRDLLISIQAYYADLCADIRVGIKNIEPEDDSYDSKRRGYILDDDPFSNGKNCVDFDWMLSDGHVIPTKTDYLVLQCSQSQRSSAVALHIDVDRPSDMIIKMIRNKQLNKKSSVGKLINYFDHKTIYVNKQRFRPLCKDAFTCNISYEDFGEFINYGAPIRIVITVREIKGEDFPIYRNISLVADDDEDDLDILIEDSDFESERLQWKYWCAQNVDDELDA